MGLIVYIVLVYSVYSSGVSILNWHDLIALLLRRVRQKRL